MTAPAWSMRCVTRRYVAWRQSRWQESFRIRFGDEPPSLEERSSLLTLLDEFAFTATSDQSLALVHARELPPTVDLKALMTNRWGTAVRDAPRLPFGEVTAGATMPDARFWPLLEKLHTRESKLATLFKLRDRLRKLTPEDVIAFQAALVQKITELREVQPETRLADAAWGLILAGEDRYRLALGERPYFSAAGFDAPEDVTDVAEWVLGAAIDVPGFGTSRSADRDRAFREEALAQAAASHDDYVPPEAWVNPHGVMLHLTGWRAVVAEDGVQREVIVWGSRPLAEGIASASQRARDLLAALGEIVTEVEVFDTENNYPRLEMYPFYLVDRRWSGDLPEYRRTFG